MSDEYLTVAEAADLLKVSIDTLKSAIRDGRIPVVEVAPRTRRISREALRALEAPLGR